MSLGSAFKLIEADEPSLTSLTSVATDSDNEPVASRIDCVVLFDTSITSAATVVTVVDTDCDNDDVCSLIDAVTSAGSDFVDNDADNAVDKSGSSFNAAAISFNVSNVSGEVSIISDLISVPSEADNECV